MTFRHDIETSVLDVAPGDLTSLRVTIHNESAASADFSLRVVGLDDRSTAAASAVLQITVEAGESAIGAVPVRVPSNIGTGHHAAAIEITSSQPGSRPVLTDFTLAISSLDGLEIAATPSPIRAKRSAKFHVDVVNHEDEPMDFSLTGEANDVRVKFAESTFFLQPGERATTRSKVRGRRLWSGEPLQHNILITAQGRASTATVTVPYVQRPVFAHGLRAAMAALVLVGLWAGAMVAGYVWLRERDAAAERAAAASITGVDTDGDGVADVFYDETGMVIAAPEAVDRDGDGIPDGHVDGDGKSVQVVTALDTDSDGIADVFVDETGATVTDPSTGADGTGAPDEIASTATPDDDVDPASVVNQPTSTTFSGTVSAQGTNDVSDITIIVAPITLDGTQNPNAEVVAFAGENGRRPGKIWSARRSSATNQLAAIRQSEAIAPRELAPGVDGIWRITDIPLRQSYEVLFSKPGFDTQSFVLTPPDSGEPVDLDVELAPAIGAIRGRVIGPNGPLGGADISITDGALTFETTADTDGDIGVFLLERLSTPGVYTLTAQLRGYGTEVVQVELGAGEQRSNVDILLTRGVGTITGRVVDETGRPLSGVAVSATNGSNSRETSSLTDGDIGFYSLPQLDVGTTYTINVALDGYSFSTRRVPVNGSIGGVNFVLVRSTSTIAGQVNSSGGGGVVAAGVTITSGDLEFRTSTTNAPDGFFEVDDLPPGNYTVTVEHFEHQTATEFLVVVAGQDPPSLQITLTELDGVPNVGTGELVVEVIDPDAEDAAERPVAAIITLALTNGNTIVPTPTEPASTVRIQNIPPGTYTLTASAEGYADSAPRQVSIGLQLERREIELQRKGSAGGRMIDSLTKQPIGPFVLELFFIIGNDEVPTGVTVTGGTDGLWVTEPRELIPGDYRVRIPASGAPQGYRVLNDQQLDPRTGQTMRFSVVPGLEETNLVRDLEADPFPDISGRVFSPRLIANATELVPIDLPADPATGSSALTATLTCAGLPGSVDANMTDLAGSSPSGAPTFDSFNITKEQIDDANFEGNCQVEVSAGGFVSSTIALPNLLPSDGFNENDRVTNIALYSPADTIGGTVFWVDDRDGSRVQLDGVDFGSNVIVSIPPNEGPPPPPGTTPTPVRQDRTAQSVGGAWALSGQVFGPATYRITEEGFNTTDFEVVIDETGNRTVTPSADITLTPPSQTTSPISPGVPYDLELNDPFNGAIAGQLNIRTTGAPAELANVGVEAFEPDQPALPAPRVATTLLIDPTPLVDGSFTITDAPVGTWDVEYTLPDNHIFYEPTLTDSTAVDADTRRVTDRLDPGDPLGVQTGFDMEIVDLARINITAVDGSMAGNPVISSEVIATITPAVAGRGVSQSTPATPASVPFEFTNVVVDTVNPATQLVTYNVTIALPGFDPNGGAVFVGPNQVATGFRNSFPVSVLAGQDVEIRVVAEPFGSIVGDIEGRLNVVAPFTVEDLDVVSLAGTGRAVVNVVAVDINGNTIAPVDPNEVLVEPTGTLGQFSVRAPAGFYRFEVSHPQFGAPVAPLPTDSLPQIIQPGIPPVVLPPPNVFQLQSGVSNVLGGMYSLPIRTSPVQIDAVEELGGAGVAPFNYTLTALNAGVPGASGVSTGPSIVVPVGIVPGLYRIEIRNGTLRFPFIADIVVRRSEQGAPLTTIITAPLPAAGARIDGEILAVNSNMDPAPVPLTTLTRTYTTSPGLVTDDQGGASEPAVNTQIAVETISVPAENILGTSGYSFVSFVAVGTHTLSVDPVVGYTAPGDVIVPVLNATSTPPTVADPLTYVASDVNVTVNVNAVTNGTFTDAAPPNPGLVVTLTDPNGVVTTGMRSGPNPLTAPVFRFLNQTPSIAQHTLTVTDPLYGGTALPYTEMITVPVGDAAGEVPPIDVSPPGVVGRLVGAILEDGGQATPALVAAATVTMTPTTPPGAAIDVTLGSDGGFFQQFDGGEYTLAFAAGDGYASQTRSVTIVNGAESTVNLAVTALAEVTVNTTPSTLPAGVTVRLRLSGSTVDILPTSGPSLSSPFVFQVDRDNDYHVVVSGTYDETFFPGPTTYETVPANGATIDVALDQQVTVNVTNPPSDLEIEVDGTVVDTAPYVFTIPGTLSSQTVDIRINPSGSPSIDLGSTTTTDALIVNETINFTTLSGTLSASDGVTIPNGTNISVSSGSTVLSGTVNGDSYSFDGLIGGLNTGSRAWTVAFLQDGIGQVDETFSITDTPGGVRTENLTVIPRTYTVTFNVRGLDNTVVTGATVTIPGLTPTSANPLAFIVRETQAAFTATASGGGASLADAMLTFDPRSQFGDETLDMTLTQQPLAISIVGAPSGSTFLICRGDPGPGACAGGRIVTPSASVGVSPFATTVAALSTARNYFVQVIEPTPPPAPTVPVTPPLINLVFTVNADGSVTTATVTAGVVTVTVFP